MGAFELVSLDQFGPTLARLARTAPQLVVDGLQRAARDSRPIVVKFHRDTSPFAPVDTGAFIRSWIVTPYMDGADLGNDAFVAPIMEWGARPHRPPREPIEAWVRRKVRGPWNDKFREPRGALSGVHDARGRTATIRAARRSATARWREFSRRPKGRLSDDVNAHFRRLIDESASEEEREIQRATDFVVSKITRRGLAPRFIMTRSWPWILRMTEHALDAALRRAANARYS